MRTLSPQTEKETWLRTADTMVSLLPYYVVL
jgi:hypothetical protein